MVVSWRLLPSGKRRQFGVNLIVPAFWLHCTTSSCQGTAHSQNSSLWCVEHKFPVVQSLGAPCLPEVGSLL